MTEVTLGARRLGELRRLIGDLPNSRALRGHYTLRPSERALPTERGRQGASLESLFGLHPEWGILTTIEQVRAGAGEDRVHATTEPPVGNRSRRTGSMIAFALALSVALAAPAAAASAPATSRVTLKSQQIYTNTGVVLHAGDTVTIRASGSIHFGGGKIANMTPPGIQAGAKCQAIAIHQPRANPFPLLGANCWSLIARVGTGPPFEVGAAKTFHAVAPR